jgi:hypothetical protein
MVLRQIADDPKSDNVETCPGVFEDTENSEDLYFRGWDPEPEAAAQITLNDREHAIRVPKRVLRQIRHLLEDA